MNLTKSFAKQSLHEQLLVVWRFFWLALHFNIRLSEGILRPTETVYHIFSLWSKNKYKNELQKNKKGFNFKILQLTCHLSIFFKTHIIFMQHRLILTLLISPFQKKPTNIQKKKSKKTHTHTHTHTHTNNQIKKQ